MFTDGEMLRLQYMKPGRLVVPNGVSMLQFRKMIGNSMSVNVLEALVVATSKAVPMVFEECVALPVEITVCQTESRCSANQ